MSAHRTYLSPYHLEGTLELHLLVIRQRRQKLYLLNKGNLDIQGGMNGLKVKTPKHSEQIGGSTPPVFVTQVNQSASNWILRIQPRHPHYNATIMNTPQA